MAHTTTGSRPGSRPRTRSRSTAGDARAEQREATRARLYEATVREFTNRGFADTEIAVVAEQVGLSRGAFYVHFTGKDEVLRELLVAEERLIAEAAGAAVGDDADVAEVFGAVIDAVLAGEQRLGRGLVRDLCAAQFRPEFAQHLTVDDHPLGLMLVDEVTRRTSGVDPVDVTMVFLTGMFGLLATGDSSTEALRRRLDLLIRGVTASLDARADSNLSDSGTPESSTSESGTPESSGSRSTRSTSRRSSRA